MGRPSRVEASAIDSDVLDAALAAFREQGYERTPMETVAARAGITKASLYRRYPNKAALLEAIAGKLAGVFDVSNAIDANLPVLERLRQQMWVYRQRAAAPERMAVQQLIVANLPFDDSLRETVVRLRKAYVAPVDQLVAKAIELHELPAIPVIRLREYLFDLLVNGAPSLGLMGLAPEDDEEAAYAWRWSLFVRSVVAHDAPAAPSFSSG